MKLQGLKSENGVLIGIAFLLVSLGAFLALGFTGLRTAAGMLIVFFLPFYLIFDNFNLGQEEKIAFSFFTGITVFPSLAYWLGFVLPFKISIFAVFILLLAVGYLSKKFIGKGHVS